MDSSAPATSAHGSNAVASSAGFDALLPVEIARRAEHLGAAKLAMPLPQVFTLAVLAGAFIALGAGFATTALAGTAGTSWGPTRVLGGVTFSLGLILVIVGGAELFTGNNLIVMAWAGGHVRARAVLVNWTVVYAGNFVGASATALLVFLAGSHHGGQGAVGAAAIGIAQAKLQLGFVQAVALGILCNALVCLAVWLSYGGRTVTDKVVAVIGPVSAFVAAGFEHSVANMYFVPSALLIARFDPDFVAAAGLTHADLSVMSFVLRNLVPVTLGNVIGGAGLVGAVYWSVYLRPRATDSDADCAPRPCPSIESAPREEGKGGGTC